MNKWLSKTFIANIFQSMKFSRVFIVGLFFLVLSLQAVLIEGSTLNYVDLRNWSGVGDVATWEHINGGRSVTQTANTTTPTFYVSDQEYANVVVRGTIESRDNDDDFIGFVFGFKTENTSYDFTLIEWGSNKRVGSNDGAMILGRFTDVGSNFDIASSHQAYTRHHSSGTFVEFDRKNTWWGEDVSYNFEILYTSTMIKVLIDGIEFVRKTTTLENPFDPGKIGFYGNSQADVFYGNVRVVNVNSENSNPVATNDTYGLVTSNGITLNVGADEGLLFNDYDPQLDEFEIIVTSPPAIGELNVVTSSGAFVYTSAGLGEYRFKYKLREIGSELESDEATVTLLIRDETNVPPSNILFTPNLGVISIERNVVIGTLDTIDANLPLDFHDLILTDNDSGQFGINGNQIIFADTSNLTPGAIRTIEVQSTDFEGASVTTNVSIKVPEFAINYALDGGTNNPSNPGYYNATSASITLLDPTKENFEFLGWFDALRGGTTVTAINLNLATDVAVYARWAFAAPDALQNQDPVIQPTISSQESGYDVELAVLYSDPNRPINLSYSTDAGITYTPYTGPFTVTTLSGLTFKGVDDLNNSRVVTDASLKPIRVVHRSSTLDELGYEDFYVLSAGAISPSDLFGFKNFTFKHFSQSTAELIPASSSTQEMYAIWDKVYETTYTVVDETGGSETSVSLINPDNGYKFLSHSISNGSVQLFITNASITRFNLDYDDGNRYLLSSTTKSYPDARDYCASNGGYLATVTSLIEHQFITQNIIGSNSNIWIGGNDITTEGSWIWENNEGSINSIGVGFNLWATGEPNDSGGQDGLVAWYSSDSADYDSEKGWDDQSTSTALKFLCEFDQPYYFTASELNMSSASPVTITTRYVVETYTLNLNSSGGSITTSTLQMGYNANLVNLPIPSRSGYTFVDWVDVNHVSASALTISENMTLTAVWRINDYTITFEVAGGEPEDAITGPYDSAIRLPAAKRPGYTLLGWYQGNQRIPYTTTVPFGNQTYTARWEANLYTLTMTNTANDETSTITAAFDSPIVVPLYTLEGYTFRGWFEGGTNVSFNRMPLGDKTIRAIMEPKPYTIQFDTQGAPSIATLTAPYMSDITLPTPVYDNHTFDGWMLNGVKTNLSTMPLEGATLVASWMKDEQTITLNNPGGDATQPITALIGEAITLPSLSKPGHTFDGWFLNGERVTLTTMPEEPVTLTAQFTIQSFTLTIRGFDNAVIQTLTQDFGSTINLPTVEKLGYLFSGWALNGNRITGNRLTMPAGGGVVSAEFLPIIYPITFIHKNESVILEAPFESHIDLPDSNVTGYAFIGWLNEGELIDELTVPLLGVTLAAQYEAFTSRQTIVTPDQTIQMTHTTDQPFTAPPLMPPSPLIFSGYYSEPFGGGIRFAATTLIENGQNARVYPYVYNPTIAFEQRDTRLLSQLSGAPHIDDTSEVDIEPTNLKPTISLLIWAVGLLGLGILYERRRG